MSNKQLVASQTYRILEQTTVGEMRTQRSLPRHFSHYYVHFNDDQPQKVQDNLEWFVMAPDDAIVTFLRQIDADVEIQYYQEHDE